MKRDQRLRGILITIAAIIVLGIIVTLMPSMQPLPVVDKSATTDDVTKSIPINARLDPQGHQRERRSIELDTRFQQAVAMLHAKQYDYAVKALHRVLELNPRMPEAHTNMGYALVGLKDYEAAADFFDTAITLKPQQLNAYYGLALAYEGQQKYILALSAMESFIHLAKDSDPYIKKARAAVWEWREKVREIEQETGAEAMTSAVEGDGPGTSDK